MPCRNHAQSQCQSITTPPRQRDASAAALARCWGGGGGPCCHSSTAAGRWSTAGPEAGPRSSSTQPQRKPKKHEEEEKKKAKNRRDPRRDPGGRRWGTPGRTGGPWAGGRGECPARGMAPAGPEPAEPPAPGPEPAAGAPAPAARSPDWAGGMPAPALALVAALLAADAERAAAFLPEKQLRYSWDGEDSSEAIRDGYSNWRKDRGADPDQRRDGLLAFAMTCKSPRRCSWEGSCARASGGSCATSGRTCWGCSCGLSVRLAARRSRRQRRQPG